MENKVVSPILIGAKSIGQYGGYESFIYKLLEYHREQKNIHYYVYCKANGRSTNKEYNRIYIL